MGTLLQSESPGEKGEEDEGEEEDGDENENEDDEGGGMAAEQRVGRLPNLPCESQSWGILRRCGQNVKGV